MTGLRAAVVVVGLVLLLVAVVVANIAYYEWLRS